MMGKFDLGILAISAISVSSKRIFNASSRVVEKGKLKSKLLKHYNSYKTIKKE